MTAVVKWREKPGSNEEGYAVPLTSPLPYAAQQ